jgi:polyisoprenoid-binding protein YceI
MPWEYDAGHSQVTWSVKYVGLSLVHGLFRQMDVNLNVEGDDPTQWSAKVTIQAASVESGVDRRDEVMRGEEYFDVEKYPTITFESKRVERDGDGYRVIGDATLHGTTRELVLTGRHVGDAQDPRGVKRRGLSGRGTLKRSDYGFHAPPLGQSMSDEVELFVDLQATMAD